MNEYESDRLERIRRIHLFEDFAEDQERLKIILSHTKAVFARQGDAIITEGEMGDTLYVLQSGTVRIQKRTLQMEEYTVVLLQDHMNIYFGEVALVDHDRRSATVVAESDCELLALTREAFLDMAEKDPVLGYRIISQIAQKISASLRKMNSDVITLFEALVSEVEESGLSV